MENLKTSPNIVVLHELQDILREAGIESQIIENTSPYVDTSGNTVTYTLLVGADDLDESIIIANKFNETAEQPKDCGWCPECGSENITKTVIRKRFSSISFLILGLLAIPVGIIFPLAFFSWVLVIGGFIAIIQFFIGHTEERYVCNKCNHKFKRY